MAKKAAKATTAGKKSAAKEKSGKAVKATKAPAKPAAKTAASKAAKPAVKEAAKVVAKSKPVAVSPAPKKVSPAKAEKKPVAIVAEPPSDVESELDAETETVPTPVVVAKPAKAAKPVKPAKSGKASLKIVKGGASNVDESHWQDFFDRHRAEKPQVYDMKAVFEANRPLQHKVLGWGWVLSNENDRLDVLFKDGRRILISNYNPNR